MKKRLLTLLMASFTLLASAQNAPIKVAFVFNITGGLSSLEAPAANGAKLAAKYINEAQGVLGQQLEVTLYDGKTDATTLANIGQQILTTRPSVVIGLADSDMTLALGPDVQNSGIPVVTVGSTSPKLPGLFGSSLFLVPFGDNVQAAAGAEYALSTLDKKSVYILTDSTTTYTTLLSGYFKDAFLQGGGSVVLEDSYIGGETDFSAQLARLRATGQKPELVFFSSYLIDDIAAFLAQARAAGYSAPVMGGDGYDSPALIEVAGANANGVYYTTHALMSRNDSPLMRRFMDAYSNEYGIDPENAFAALGYDAVGFVADAIRRADSSDPARISATLSATSGYQAITGTISYTGNSRIPKKTVTIVGVDKYKFFVADSFVPAYIPAP